MRNKSFLFTRKPLSLAIAATVSAAASLHATPAIAAEGCAVLSDTYTVTESVGDTSIGGLAFAVGVANSTPGCQRITFADNVTDISLDAGLALTDSDGIEIVGNGGGVTTISTTGTYDTVFNSTTGDLYVSDIAIKNSYQAINKSNRKLIIDNVLLDTNTYGINISTSVDSQILNTIIQNGNGGTPINFASGGTDANLLIEDSQILNNSIASSSSLYVYASNKTTVTINNSTFAGNSGYNGAAIRTDNQAALSPTTTLTLTIENSTISDNTDSNLYGAIHISDSSTSQSLVNINHSTIINNNSSGGIRSSISSTTTLNIDHSVIANNAGATAYNLAGVFTTATNSWIGVNGSIFSSSFSNPTASSQLNKDNGGLMINDLAYNGGYTQTHLPQSGSPLINAGDANGSGFPDTDQRGEARVSGSAVDIGAVEVQPASAFVASKSSGGALSVFSLFFLFGMNLFRNKKK